LETNSSVPHLLPPEVTAFDLAGYPHHAGGLDNAATVLSDLAESIDAAKLASITELSPVAWSQRLGYLLNQYGKCPGYSRNNWNGNN